MPERPTVGDLADTLAAYVDADRGWREGDPSGVWVASDRLIRRLGLGLEAGRAPYPWADDLDAVLLHRPFGLWPARLPEGLGVLAYHGPLDRLVWHGPALPRALGLAPDDAPLVRGEPVGTVGAFPAPLSWDDLLARLAEAVGPPEAITEPAEAGPVERVAVVGAMTDALVEEAAARGATVYVTGQVRGPAQEAVRQAGLGVVAMGQEPAERWGLRWLGTRLREAWPGLETVDLDV